MGSPDSEGRIVGELHLPLRYGSYRWNTIFSFIHKTLEFSVKDEWHLGEFLQSGFFCKLVRLWKEVVDLLFFYLDAGYAKLCGLIFSYNC